MAVYNYETGEILCMVSAPSYDPLNVPADIETNDRYKGAYLNRFLSSTFTPGSVYKTVTLAAALEEIPDLAERHLDLLSGSVQMGDETIICSGTHGEQDIASAFANCCNVAFAQIAQELGPGTLEKYTEQAGLTGSYSISGLPTATGSFDFDGITDGQLGWAGVGQYHDQVNPAPLMIYMGAIANGGKAAEPYLILRTESALGLPSLPHFTTRTGTPDFCRYGGRAGGHDGQQRDRRPTAPAAFPIWTSAPSPAPPRWGRARRPTPGLPASSGGRRRPTPLWCWWRTAAAGPLWRARWPPRCWM